MTVGGHLQCQHMLCILFDRVCFNCGAQASWSQTSGDSRLCLPFLFRSASITETQTTHSVYVNYRVRTKVLTFA